MSDIPTAHFDKDHFMNPHNAPVPTPPDTTKIANKAATAISRWAYSKTAGCSLSVKELTPFVDSAITEATAPLLERIAELEKERETVINTNDTKHPFYIETAEQVEQLRTLAKAASLHPYSIKNLNEAARKLEYFNRCFTLNSNHLPLELGIEMLKKQNAELVELLGKCKPYLERHLINHIESMKGADPESQFYGEDICTQPILTAIRAAMEGKE